MLCSHCNKTNHTVENCYFKHGFPPGYKSKTQLSNESSSDGKKSQLGNSFVNDSLIKEDYQFLVNLLKSSKDIGSNSSTNKDHGVVHNPHVVSSISKTGYGYTKRMIGNVDLINILYILDTSHFTGVLDSYRVYASVNTPMMKDNKLSNTNGTHLQDPSIYRRLIDKLIYLTNTRPNISFYVQQLNKHMNSLQTLTVRQL